MSNPKDLLPRSINFRLKANLISNQKVNQIQRKTTMCSHLSLLLLNKKLLLLLTFKALERETSTTSQVSWGKERKLLKTLNLLKKTLFCIVLLMLSDLLKLTELDKENLMTLISMILNSQPSLSVWDQTSKNQLGKNLMKFQELPTLENILTLMTLIQDLSVVPNSWVLCQELPNLKQTQRDLLKTNRPIQMDFIWSDSL